MSEVRGAEALPEPPLTRTGTFGEYKYQSSSPIQGTDLEWDHLLPSNKPFTPDSYHADLARKLAQSQKDRERRISAIFPKY